MGKYFNMNIFLLSLSKRFYDFIVLIKFTSLTNRFVYPPKNLLKNTIESTTFSKMQKLEKEKGFSSVWELLNCGKYEKGNDNYFPPKKRQKRPLEATLCVI